MLYRKSASRSDILMCFYSLLTSVYSGNKYIFRIKLQAGYYSHHCHSRRQDKAKD